MKNYSQYFITKTRDSGESFICLTDQAPEELQSLVEEAHEGMLPDNYKYQFLLESFQSLEDREYNFDHTREAIESDVYYRDLLTWVSSHVDRPSMCDEAALDLGAVDADLMYLIALGQQQEKSRVLEHVIDFLELEQDIQD